MNIVFAGTPEFAAEHLKGLLEAGIKVTAVVTQPDKPGKRGKKLIASSVKELATQNNLAVIQPEKFTSEDLAPYACDLLIVVAYGQILRQKLLDTPRFGCINVHGSILPRWRGAAPIQRAIEAGDTQTGICIMQMDAGLDTGPVLHESRVPITDQDTSNDLSSKLIEIGVRGLIQVIDQITTATTMPVPQVPEGATYAKKIEKLEAKIDWTKDAHAIIRKIHAFNPDPVCYSELTHEDKSLRLKVHRAKLCTNSVQASAIEDNNEPPGTIVEVSKQGVEVATVDGSILLTQVQLPLGKGSILSGSDVVNSRMDILHSGVKLT